jgi:hypothetical protein
MELQPGDEFGEISLGRKHIHLRQIDHLKKYPIGLYDLL